MQWHICSLYSINNRNSFMANTPMEPSQCRIANFLIPNIREDSYKKQILREKQTNELTNGGSAKKLSARSQYYYAHCSSMLVMSVPANQCCLQCKSLTSVIWFQVSTLNLLLCLSYQCCNGMTSKWSCNDTQRGWSCRKCCQGIGK